MGASSLYPSSLSCEISLLQAKNLELKSHGNLFVRFYLSAGNNRKLIQLNSQEISSKSSLFWNQSFSLECSSSGTDLDREFSIDNLKEESVVFELRWRNTNPILGKITGGSQLLGRAEIPWKTVVESPEMEIEKWVMMIGSSKKSCGLLVDGVKPPSLQIAMKVRVSEMAAMEKKKKKRNGKLREEYGCCRESGCKCEDYEIFAMVGAFETL
ncbi:uncharacterized protein LOC110628644 [Manihot esculenta]|uniref:C2 domain-containing protein n=1 Tax=Manihot esculenta TaxID=3983 RepID=A0A2C9UY94_MANES|nr:uncharacterized protein LOC110628644 [Manihot esculenta]OAY35848.1 hypothetical protein MANES_12G135500v8 [Manihot esculenta]